jgi:CRISPR-associated protein Csd1
LAKLRKKGSAGTAAAKAIDREIGMIVQRLVGGKFPGRLSLEDQGRFAIGFYHQRAEDMARAKERKQNKEEGEQE